MFLSDLLPLPSSSFIRDKEMRNIIIDLLSFFIKETINALESFDKGKMHCFDPHVGETSCQIRALIMLELFCKKSNLIFFKEKIINDLKKAEDNIFFFKSSDDKIWKNHSNLLEFVKFLNCNIELSKEIIFLIRSYFLTRFTEKTKEGITFIDYERIYNELNCSKRITKKIIRNQQAALSEYSCKSVFNWYRENSSNQLPINLFKKMMLRDDDNRYVLPYYYFTQIIWNNLIKKQYPVLVIINRYSQEKLDTIYLTFFYSAELGTWMLQHNLNFTSQKAYFVIEGEMKYKSNWLIETKEDYTNRFINIGLSNIVMANMAQHPQYSGNKLNLFKYDPFQGIKLNALEEKIAYNEKQCLMRKRETALYNGCCKENPTLFFIRHIYCDILSHRLENILYQDIANLRLMENPYYSINSSINQLSI